MRGTVGAVLWHEAIQQRLLGHFTYVKSIIWHLNTEIVSPFKCFPTGGCLLECGFCLSNSRLLARRDAFDWLRFCPVVPSRLRHSCPHCFHVKLTSYRFSAPPPV